MNRKEREKKETPIVDGDTRPDMPVEPAREKEVRRNERSGNREKFESERLSDTNSLEDYKDAK